MTSFSMSATFISRPAGSWVISQTISPRISATVLPATGSRAGPSEASFGSVVLPGMPPQILFRQ